MNDLNDQQLLRDYLERRSEAAFGELVRRHLDLVYSAAVRLMRDQHLAEDVTQAVFVALAKNAAQLSAHPVLSGWLHCTTRNLAANTIRTNVRRQAREEEAAFMIKLLSTASDPLWEQITPHLDAALGELGEADRDALLLRYFERKSAREMAQILNTSEEAAQKRVNRAVERLREFLSKRGVAIGAGGLVALISTNAVHAAPLALVSTISTAAVLAGTTIHTSTAITATKVIAMTTLQKTIVAAIVAAVTATGIYETRQAADLRRQVIALQQQQAPLAAQVEQMRRERDAAAYQLAEMAGAIAKVQTNNLELLKLRSENTSLRNVSEGPKDDPTGSAAKAWLDRVNQLKQRLAQNPKESIPELQFLKGDDWLNAAMNPLATEIDIRRALGSLRSIASSRVAGNLFHALNEFRAQNNDQFPVDVSQLAPFSNPPLDNTVLSRWEVQPAGNFTGPEIPRGDWLIVQKTAVDEENDYRWLVGVTSDNCIPFHDERAKRMEQVRHLEPILKTVQDAYAAANNGKKPENPLDVLPYATTPEQQAAVQLVVQLYRQAAASPTIQNSGTN